eukprot:3591865-Amphidinium_carterae.1
MVPCSRTLFQLTAILLGNKDEPATKDSLERSYLLSKSSKGRRTDLLAQKGKMRLPHCSLSALVARGLSNNDIRDKPAVGTTKENVYPCSHSPQGSSAYNKNSYSNMHT